MLQKILSNVHLAIFLYYGYSIYEQYNEHNEILEGFKGAEEGIQRQIQKSNEDKKIVDAALGDIHKIKEEVERMNREIDQLQEKLPSDVSPDKDMAIFRRIAEELNMAKIDISPNKEENKGPYYINRYQFKSTATFLQSLIFFEKIRDSQRIFNVKSVRIEVPEGGGRGRFQLVQTHATLESFRQNNDRRKEENTEMTDASGRQASVEVE